MIGNRPPLMINARAEALSSKPGRRGNRRGGLYLFYALARLQIDCLRLVRVG
jgi:hypothetical protein